MHVGRWWDARYTACVECGQTGFWDQSRRATAVGEDTDFARQHRGSIAGRA